MPPKWLLTHPSGEIMLVEGLRLLDLRGFERIIVTVTQAQIESYDVGLILEQAFSSVPKFELCVLPGVTSGPLETVVVTISKKNVVGPVVIKDSDNCVGASVADILGRENFVVGSSLRENRVRNPENKSYLLINEQGFLVDIVEKRIRSELMCAGVYGFSSASDIASQGNQILHSHAQLGSEAFVSHLVAQMVIAESTAFRYVPASHFEDWGTVEEWRSLQKDNQSIFLDFDGVVLSNRGRYGRQNWRNSVDELGDNLSRLRELVEKGAQIIVTTSRPVEYEKQIREMFEQSRIPIHTVVCGLNHSPRMLINDFAPTNPYPSALAVSLPRDGRLRDFV